MEYLQNGFTLEVPKGCFPLSTDSILLSDFVKLPKDAVVLDLGSGCGTLGLLLCAKDPHCTIFGMELDPAAHRAAEDNIRRNGLQDRLHSICADLRSVSRGEYAVCVSNPPYFTGGPASQNTPAARRDDHCTIAELMDAAARALKYGGDLFLVHKPDKLAQIIACGSSRGLEAKRLRLVRHREGSEISLILLQFRKGGKPGLLWDEVALHYQDGTPTPDYKKIYHIE